jgi:hypothetical protein
MESYQQNAPRQCPVCDSSPETLGRRGSTTLHRCPKCLLESDILDLKPRARALDNADLRHKPVSGAPARPTCPEASRTGKPGQDLCPRCGSSNLSEIALTAGPHYSSTRCDDCGRHLKFNPRPWTLERALAFELPYGKHRGSKVGELAKSGIGKSYLAWMATNLSGNPGTAARIALGIDPAAPADNPDDRTAGRRGA